VASLYKSEKAVFIFLANKIDLKSTKSDYLTTEDIIRKFDLEKFAAFPQQSFRIFEVSAKTGENVSSAITWFFEKLTERIREQTMISFTFIHNKELRLLYTNAREKSKIQTLEKILCKKITEAREKGVRDKYIAVGEYQIFFLIDDEFSIILGTKHNVSEKKLKNAAYHISQLIKERYYPPEQYLEKLDGLVNLALIREKVKS